MSSVRAVVAEASFATLDLEIDHVFRRRIGLPGYLAGALFTPFSSWRTGVDSRAVRPIDTIRELECPVLIIGGSEERSVYREETEALYSAASDPKRLWILEGASHEDFFARDREEYERVVWGFLAEAMGDRAAD